MAQMIPIAIMAAGTMMQHKASEDSLAGQSKLISQEQLARSAKAREGTGVTSRLIDTLQPDARSAQDAAIRAEMEGQLGRSIDTARSYEQPEQFGGKVSDDYYSARETGRQTVNDRLRRALEQMSTLGVSGQRGLEDKFRYSQAASDIGGLQGDSAGLGRAYGAARSLEQPDPFLNLAGQLTQGVGMGYAMRPRR